MHANNWSLEWLLGQRQEKSQSIRVLWANASATAMPRALRKYKINSPNMRWSKTEKELQSFLQLMMHALIEITITVTVAVVLFSTYKQLQIYT